MYGGMMQSAGQRQRGYREVSAVKSRMKEHTNRVAKSLAYVRTETGYKAVSPDDLP